MRFRELIAICLGIFLFLNVFAVHADDKTDSEQDLSTTLSNKDKIGAMLLQSMSLIGIPYKWGGNTPKTGLDCSGFIHYVYKKALGINLPRTAAEMAVLGRKIPLSEIEPGDLLFFNTLGGRRVSHIGMYLGNNKFIQSPRRGKRIEITEFNEYYHSKFIVAKRMFEEEVDAHGHVVLNDFRDERDTFTIKATARPKSKKHRRTRAYRSGIKARKKKPG